MPIWIRSILFQALNRISPSPFSAFYSVDKKYLLCASPERYLKKKGDSILVATHQGNICEGPGRRRYMDEELKAGLAASEKDRAENVMVVDLVRNDLSKICETDSVRVAELFGIYSFAQVHQMISTVAGKPQRRSALERNDCQRTFPYGIHDRCTQKTCTGTDRTI